MSFSATVYNVINMSFSSTVSNAINMSFSATCFARRQIPGAVGSGGHLGLLGTEEKVEDVLGLNLHAMISQLVSAVQAQAAEINELKAEVDELRAGA